MAVRILAAWDVKTKEILSDAIIAKDATALKKKHKAALKKEPTWLAFGGVITIKNHSYQVVEDIDEQDKIRQRNSRASTKT